MKIELHVLQNFAPSNLNRDDTGAPKDCELGGYRRARISSQCQKRAVREAFRLEGLVSGDDLAARTKRLAQEVVEHLVEQHKRDKTEALAVAIHTLQGMKIGFKEEGPLEEWKTQYLLFVPRRVVRELADLLHKYWGTLQPLTTKQPAPAAEVEAQTEGAESKKGKGKAAKPKRDAKKDKNDKANEYPPEIKKELGVLLQGARTAVDLALFGRMIADKSEIKNVEASCQIAHAISTNKVQMDFDFFTAVDDFKPGDTAGSDMMGTVQFNSSCFYRYAVLDVTSLASNLDQPDAKDGKALLQTAVSAFLKAFSSAIPTGKQNSMAAHNPPSYLLAVVREKGASVALTNAFLKPARPRGDDVDLVDDSIDKIESYLAHMEEHLEGATLLTWADRKIEKPAKGVQRKAKMKELFDGVLAQAVGGGS